MNGHCWNHQHIAIALAWHENHRQSKRKNPTVLPNSHSDSKILTRRDFSFPGKDAAKEHNSWRNEWINGLFVASCSEDRIKQWGSNVSVESAKWKTVRDELSNLMQQSRLGEVNPYTVMNIGLFSWVMKLCFGDVSFD